MTGLVGGAGTVVVKITRWPLVVAGLCTIALSGPAYAASCSQLQAQLTRAENSSAGAEAQKWRTASEQQQRAIAAARRDARHFRCGTASAGQRCDGLMQKISRMETNLAAIDKRLARTSGSKAGQIRAAMARQKCGSGQTQKPRQADAGSGGQERGLFGRLFSSQNSGKPQEYRTLPSGRVVPAQSGRGDEARSAEQDLAQIRARAAQDRQRKRLSLPTGGTYRTLCVRTCDGFFFPVSFSTGKDQFANDAARCAEMCPAAETDLFVHRNPGGMQEEMVSLTGIAYTDHANAYRFRREYVDGCSCRSATTTAATGRLQALSTSSDPQTAASDPLRPTTVAWSLPVDTEFGLAGFRGPYSTVPLARDQLPAYADPGTRMNLQEGFDPTAPIVPAAANPSKAEPPKPADPDGGTASLPVLGSTPSGAPPAISQADRGKGTSDPVFSKRDPDTGAAVNKNGLGSIRVVGPEHFVAQ